MWGHYGSKVMGFIQGPLVRCQVQLSISFNGICLLSMEDCAPFASLGSQDLVAPYLCSRFCIFNKPILEEFVSQVEGGPHLLQSCLCVVQNNLPLVVKEMHHSFENLVVIDALGLQAFLIDIHHDASFRFILEVDSSSSISKVCICFIRAKGQGYG